ncbi:MAG: zinc-dependent dehydrogenase [Candidatus Thermoplasmatota archaeon]|nr:zinc-dependent dehydrogenase [Candidatus Thermoplasmatota archaeon]
MRVAMYYNNKDIRLEEMPVPEIGRDELLVKVMASGICGSDVIEWYRLPKAPRVLGHEISGEIVETGSDVKEYEEGQRVFVSHHVPCMECRFCQRENHTVCETLRTTNFDPGGFSEYVRVPSINVEHGVYPLPDEVSHEQAVFIEPLACVIRGQKKVRGIEDGNVVVVGSGLTGILHVQLAKSRGASNVACTDISDYRLEMARKFGADAAIPASDAVPDRLRDALGGLLADVVIVSTGARKAIEQSWSLVEWGGSVLFFAPTDPDTMIPMPFNDIWFKNVTATTSYAAGKQDILDAIELIASRQIRVQEMITHRLGLGETAKGFDLVLRAADSLKVIVEPQN